MTGVRLRSRPVDQRDRDWRPGGRQRRWASGWRIWILLGAVVAVLAAALWAVVWSPLLGARHISVRGALHYLTRAEVERVAQVPPGRPLMRLDTGAIAHRVEGLPEVATVNVAAAFPSTVVITLTERVGVGYVTSGGEVHLVDRTGRQFRTVATAPRGLPQFQVADGPRAQASAAAAATAASALPGSVLSLLATIQADDPAGISLVLRDHRVVRWGSPDRSSDKARVISALLARSGTVFDVSDPDLVYAR
jgi:cell division protein FtsQ